LIILVLVRNAVRRGKLRREERRRRMRSFVKTAGRSERSRMREDSDHSTVANTIVRSERRVHKREPPKA
jgi:hypothetical protein